MFFFILTVWNYRRIVYGEIGMLGPVEKQIKDYPKSGSLPENGGQ